MTDEQRQILREVAEKIKGRSLFPEKVARAKWILEHSTFVELKESPFEQPDQNADETV